MSAARDNGAIVSASNTVVTLRLMTERDLPMLHDWLNRPHIVECWLTPREVRMDASIPAGTEIARPFLPAKDFDLSKRFYEALGFAKVLDDEVTDRLRDRPLRRALARGATPTGHPA